MTDQKLSKLELIPFKPFDRVVVDSSGPPEIRGVHATIKELRPENNGAILVLDDPPEGYPREGGFGFGEFYLLKEQ